MTETTIIYYTANTEQPALEQKIRDNILRVSGGLPIISVSRKPIDFGENICVGEQPVSYATAYRQLLLGLKAAKTKYCIAAEADVLYPPEYFQFTPPTDNHVYRYANIWILYLWSSHKYYGAFWHKRFTEGAQMCGREHWIEAIEKVISPTDWLNTRQPTGLIFRGGLLEEYSWTSENAVITCKTLCNVNRYTTRSSTAVESLPYWGTWQGVKRMLYEN